MADTAPVMIWASGADKGCTYFNKQWLDFTGRALQQELGNGWASGVHQEDLQRCLQTYNSAFDRRERFRMEYRLRRADGQFRWIYDTGTPRLSPGGEFLGYIGSCVDIEDRKRAEEDLRESETRLRAFFKNSPNLIFMKDPQGRYLYVNQEIERVLRITEEQIKGKRDDEVFPQEQAATYQANDRQVLQAGTPMEFEEIFVKEDEPHTTIVHKFPLFNAEGTIYAIGGVATDITERKRTEEALQEAQARLAHITRVMAMGELAAAIAHEVNQPLSAIVTNANFCLRQLDGGTRHSREFREAISEIVDDGTRASLVIARIRGLLRNWTPDRTETDINDVIQEVIKLLRNELSRSRVSLRTELESNLPGVVADSVQLQQVLINLVMNAVEAMRFSSRSPHKLLIRSAKSSEGILVQVRDSGPGIDSEVAGRIFDPFFTTKAEGIGMGLSISRSIVESHGGQLSLLPASEGALFQFTLPAANGVS
jgi:PAS domain S-box-containing protein